MTIRPNRETIDCLNMADDRTYNLYQDDEDEDSQEEDLQGQIADIPLEELQKARCDGRSSYSYSHRQDIPKRANKNRPSEMSSKKPVGRFREVIQAPKRVFKDPRFESLCGSYDESRFKKSYCFLYEEELPAERKRLQKLLDKDKSTGANEVVHRHISWIDSQLKEEQHRRKKAERSMQQRTNEKEAVAKGKKPFYPKKSELRKQELLEKYDELKASGKLDKFLAKRRRKNAAKDHRYVPYRRPHAK